MIERLSIELGLGEVWVCWYVIFFNYYDYLVVIGVIFVLDGWIFMLDGVGEIIVIGEGVK